MRPVAPPSHSTRDAVRGGPRWPVATTKPLSGCSQVFGHIRNHTPIWLHADSQPILRIMVKPSFEWDSAKDEANQEKHGVAFALAQGAFLDPERVIARDLTHSTAREERFYCFGQVGGGILTVRFTFRNRVIRIIGAGYWRKGRKIYETQNQVQRRSIGRTRDR